MTEPLMADGKTLFFIAVFDLLVGSAACWLLWLLLSATPSESGKFSQLIHLGALSMVGAVLGGVVRCFQGLHDFGLIKNQFLQRHIGSYIVGPLAAALLGLVIFVLVHSGILLLTGGTAEPGSEMTELANVALGILAGFGWEQALTKMSSGAKSWLGQQSPTADRTAAGSPEAPKPPSFVPQK